MLGIRGGDVWDPDDVVELDELLSSVVRDEGDDVVCVSDEVAEALEALVWTSTNWDDFTSHRARV